MEALVPSNFSSRGRPTQTDLLAWYNKFWSNGTATDPEKNPSIQRIILVPVSDECRHNLCPSIQWEGDPDVSGLGMLISYYSEIVLATVFAAILALAHIGPVARLGSRVAGTLPRKLHARLVHGAFVESAEGFLYAMLLFAVGMNLATIYRLASSLRHRDRPTGLYGLQGSIYASAFSILPAVLLQSAARSRHLGKNFLCQTLWLLLLAVFAIAVSAPAARRANAIDDLLGAMENFEEGDPDSEADWPVFIANMQDMLWATACDNSGLRNTIVHTYQLVCAYLCLNAL